MEGYDTLLLANFFGLPQFNQKYGKLDPKTGTYQISAAWRSGLTNGAGVGEILGLFATGIIQERFWVPQDNHGRTVDDHWLYLHNILRHQLTHVTCRRDSLRPSMGCLPDNHHCVRL